MSSRASEPLFAPCTPAGVIRLLESTGVPLAGAHTVILGRSDIVGSPVASMLRNKDATITQCHSKTKNIEEIVRLHPFFLNYCLLKCCQVKTADVVVSAIGKPEYVKGSWLKPGAVVIDVGINYVPGKLFFPLPYQCSHQVSSDETKKSGQRLVGDVEFATASQVASHITPVPGGVGPMTVALLMENTLKSAERLWEEARSRKIKPLKLNILEKVPSDIEISMAQTPKPISQLAEEIGLLPDELENYGKYKAKVDLSVLDRLARRKDGKYIVVSG